MTFISGSSQGMTTKSRSRVGIYTHLGPGVDGRGAYVTETRSRYRGGRTEGEGRVLLASEGQRHDETKHWTKLKSRTCKEHDRIFQSRKFSYKTYKKRL